MPAPSLLDARRGVSAAGKRTRCPPGSLRPGTVERALQRGADEFVLGAPRAPHSCCPFPGSPLVVVEMVCPDHVKHGERPRALGTREDSEVALTTSKNLAEQFCHVGMGQVVFEHCAEADEVYEHRLAVSSVVAVAGVLCHICVDHHPVRWRISEPLRLVGLDLAKGLPAARSARHVLVYRSVGVGHDRAAAGAFGLGHDRKTRSCRVPRRGRRAGCSRPPVRVRGLARLDVDRRRGGGVARSSGCSRARRATQQFGRVSGRR